MFTGLTSPLSIALVIIYPVPVSAAVCLTDFTLHRLRAERGRARDLRLETPPEVDVVPIALQRPERVAGQILPHDRLQAETRHHVRGAVRRVRTIPTVQNLG